MKRGMGIIKSFFLLAGLWMLYMPLRAQAINLENSPYIMVESYELSDEKIVPGEDFTLSLTLKNYSVSVTARDVLVNVENPGGIAPGLRDGFPDLGGRDGAGGNGDGKL